MATKSFPVEINVESGDVKIATDRVLSLVQEIRILEKFKNTPGLTADQFAVLSKKINDSKDTLAATNARGKEFFSTLSLLPGPVGAFSNELDGSIGLLKTFTQFSAKDIKNQFVGLGGDIKEIGQSLLKATGLQKAFQVTSNLTAKALNMVGINANAASFGVKAFSGALLASGIGAAIFLIYKLVDSFETAKSATDSYKESVDELNKSLDQQRADIKRRNEIALSDAKAVGKSERQIIEERISGVEELYNVEKKRYDDLRIQAEEQFFRAQVRNSETFSDDKKLLTMMEEERDKQFQKVLESEKDLILAKNELREFDLKEEQKKNEKSKQNSDKAYEQLLDDLEAYEKMKLQMTREYNALSVKEGLERSLQELQNQKLVEEDNIKKLFTGTKDPKLVAKRDELLLLLERNFGIKRTEIIQKYEKEQLQIKQEFENRLLELIQSVYTDNIDLQEKVLNRQLQIQKDEYKKQVKEFNERNKDIKISAEEQAQFLTALELQTQDKITQLQIDGINKRTEQVSARLQSGVNQTRNFMDEIMLQLDQSINEFMKKGKASADINKFFSKGIFEEVNIDVRDELKKRLKIIQESFELEKMVVENGFNQQIHILRKKQEAYEKDTDEYKFYSTKIQETETAKNKKLEQLGQDNLQNRQNIIGQLINLDQLEIDSNRAVADSKIETVQKIGEFIGSLQGIYDAAFQRDQNRLDEQLKNEEKGSQEYNKILQQKYENEQKYLKRVKAIQIASALFDAGVAIARIIMDTQRAIMAFKASVAILGPAAPPLEAAYNAQARAQQALSIGIIGAQTIAKIMNISGQQGSQEAPDTSPGGARGMEKGGVIKGRRHAQGGTLIEAEDGEAIMNRNSTAMFLPLLSAMNQMGGGTSFANDFMTLPDKPMVSSPSQDNNLFIKTYVVEQDISNAQYKHARLKELTTL